MTLEDLDKALTHPNIIHFAQDDSTGFDRNRHFIVNNTVYRIEWWCNMIYLHMPQSKLMVAADTVNQNGNWPNSAKLNLAFSYGDKTVAIIELEQYGEAK